MNEFTRNLVTFKNELIEQSEKVMIIVYYDRNIDNDKRRLRFFADKFLQLQEMKILLGIMFLKTIDLG